ncbi:MAG: CBS domain-containing protein [Anaerolineae bacterium]|nr:CBS domain-containing protein [Anaerolineae bacterium]MDW8071423.1 CBS domain-containing protein [Anaerolineae bacterium]
MFVGDYMTRHPLTVTPDTSIVEVQGMMAENNIRHVPVVEKGKRLVGLVTRQNLRLSPIELSSLNVWEITRLLSGLKVKDVMVRGKDVITARPDTPIEEAARILVTHRIGCLPVLEEGILVGIITESDLLTQLTNLLGLQVPGWRATIRVPDRAGEFAKITAAVASKGWGIDAAGSLPTPRKPGYWDVVIKISAATRDELVAVLQQIEGQELIDIRATGP